MLFVATCVTIDKNTFSFRTASFKTDASFNHHLLFTHNITATTKILNKLEKKIGNLSSIAVQVVKLGVSIKGRGQVKNNTHICQNTLVQADITGQRHEPGGGGKVPTSDFMERYK